MSIRTFSRLRSWICVMVLLAIVAALVPAHRTSAQEQKVVLTKEQVEQAMWNANWNEKTPLLGQKVEGLFLSYLMTNAGDLKRNDPRVIELLRRYYAQLGPRGVDPDYRNYLQNDEIARAMFDAGSSMEDFKDSVKTSIRQLAETEFLVDSEEYRLIGFAVLDYGDAMFKHQSEVQQAAVERAKNDPQFADAYDSFNEGRLGVSIKNFDSKKFLDGHLDLPIASQMLSNLRADGSMELSLADLEALSTIEFGKINASIGDIQQTLGTISAQQQDLVDFMHNQQARQQAQALAEAKAREHQLKLQAADSAISIISTLAGFIDPKVGYQIATVGHAALQIGESLNGWMEAVAGLNTLDKLTSLSTVVMTGNVLSAVMNVVSLFGPQQPTPEQMILEEIGKLRQQVDQLRTEMHDRFDRVDQELNTIYTTMNDRFNQIDVQLGKINGSLAEVQQSLVTISLALSRMERNNFEFLDALGRRPLLDAINGAIGYKQRTGLNMPYQPDFVDYENTFQTWGTINAFDALSAGPSQRDYSDAQVLAELSASPLDANLNYLNGWLSAHGLTPFATKRLASPRDWTFASRAYARIGLDWPAHLRRIDPKRQAALDAVGNDLAVALGNISTIRASSGPQGNTPLFTAVMSYYTTKLAALDTALQSSEAAFVQEVRGGLQRTEPFDLFGGIDQPLAYQPADVITMNCGDRHDGIAAPQNLKNIIPEYNRTTLADYLRVSPLTVCVSGQWVDIYQDNCQFDPITRTVVCEDFGTPVATITVKSNNVVLASRSVAGGAAESILGTDLWAEIMGRWSTVYKPAFEAQFATATPNDVALSPEAASQLTTLTSDLASRLAGYQRDLYGRALSGLNSGGTLHGAAVELGGAKKLLDSLITLGFSQAVDRDDFLRSLLFSTQRVLDDQQVLAAYTASQAAVGSTPQTSNPRLALLAVGQKRREALSSLLTRYLTSISAGTHSEDNSMIANARFDLRMAQRFATPATPPAQSRRVFVPLVGR